MNKKEFEELAKPLNEWLQKNGHPNMIIIISFDGAEVVEGKLGVPFQILDLEKQSEQESFDYEKAHIQQNDFAPKSALEAIKEEKLDNQTCVKPVDVRTTGYWHVEDVEQKPVEWHREDEQNLNACLGFIPDEYLRKWLNDAIHVKYDKTTWSEEDESYLKSALWHISYAMSNGRETSIRCDLTEWLKSLKDRISQPKQEWSEENEMHLNYAIHAVEDMLGDYGKNTIAWLKSLRPQSQWKPSDEQMKALEHFVRIIGESGYDDNTKLLYSLLSDLKKLREK